VAVERKGLGNWSTEYHLNEGRKKMIKKIMNFLKDEEGATMVEYALMLALIAIVCIVAVTAVGDNANTVFDTSATKLEGAVNAGS
jgi:pilus assembly protein Flp/PilA